MDWVLNYSLLHVLEVERHMIPVIEWLLPKGITKCQLPDGEMPVNKNYIPITGDNIPATVVRLHTTLSKSGKRRCKLVPA